MKIPRLNMYEAVEFGARSQGVRLDAGETGTFARKLEFILAKTYDVEYVQLQSRLFVPVNNSPDPGSDKVTYSQYDHLGEAKITTDYAADGPLAEIVGKQYSTPVHSITSSYQFSNMDLKRAMMAGFPLDAKKAFAARDFILRKMESIAFLGDATYSLYGLTTHPGVQTGVSTVGTTGGWPGANSGAGATPAQVLLDVQKMYNAIFTATNGIHKANTLLLGVNAYAYINSTPQSATFMNKTIKQYLLEMMPELSTIECVPRLNAGDKTGQSSNVYDAQELAVMYEKNPDVLEQMIPLDFEQMAPQARGYSWIVNCHARHGGVQVRRPLAVYLMSGTNGHP